MNLPALVFDNPVLMRELRRRMRQRNTVILFLVYLGAMCLIAWQTISWQTSAFIAQGQFQGISMFGRSSTGMRISDIGERVYGSILLLQGFLVLALAPSITSGMVKGEKERETFEFLRATTITPFSYLVGALLSSLLLVALSLLCAFPVLSIALLYGGVQGLIPALLTLLAVSMLLSSHGLMMSASAEKLRAVGAHGGGLGLGFGIGVFFFYMMFSGFARQWSQSGAGFLTSPVTILNIPLWIFVCGLCVVGTLICLLIAHRKFFDASERALNPRQFALTWLLALGLAGLVAAGKLTNSTPVTQAGRLAAVTAPMVVALLGGYLAAPILMLTRLRMGDERWHLRNRNPALRHRDDTLRHTLTAQALALVMFAGLMAFVFSDNLERVATVTLSAAMSMGIVNMATRLFLHRSPFVSQAGNWSRLLIAGLVVFPLVGLMFGGWEAELLTALSPIGSAILLSSPTSSTSAVLSAMLVAPAVLTLAAVLLWPFASKSRDQHASEIVAYDDGTVELTYDEDGQMLNPPNAEGGNSSGSVPNPV